VDRSIELAAERFPEEFIQDSSVEALDEAVGTRGGDLSSSVIDIIEVQENLVGMDQETSGTSIEL
jgi:hypothetical protein